VNGEDKLLKWPCTLAKMTAATIPYLPIEDATRATLKDILDTYEMQFTRDELALASLFNTLYFDAMRGTQERRQEALAKMTIHHASTANAYPRLEASFHRLHAKALDQYTEDFSTRTNI